MASEAKHPQDLEIDWELQQSSLEPPERAFSTAMPEPGGIQGGVSRLGISKPGTHCSDGGVRAWTVWDAGGRTHSSSSSDPRGVRLPSCSPSHSCSAQNMELIHTSPSPEPPLSGEQQILGSRGQAAAFPGKARAVNQLHTASPALQSPRQGQSEPRVLQEP